MSHRMKLGALVGAGALGALALAVLLWGGGETPPAAPSAAEAESQRIADELAEIEAIAR